MIEKNPYLITTLTTLVSTIALFIVKYFIGQTVDFTDIVVFAIVFWVGFFLFSKIFSKKK